MITSNSKLDFAVLQAGARMHYAVPALLAQTNQLRAFYTDLHAEHAWLQWVNNSKLKSYNSIKRLLGRQLPQDIPKSLVRDKPLTTLSATLLNHLPGININSDQAILKQAAKERFAGASALYTNFINCDLSVIQYAKELGLFCIHELIIGADVGRILLEEQQLFPNIELQVENSDNVEDGIQRDQKKWEVVDKILVPSQYCFDSCIELGVAPSKLSIVPYGISEDWLNFPTAPEIGRILFVGQVGLRKGNHYLAEATRSLNKQGFRGNVRVVGPLLVDVENPIFQGPNYLGQIPRSLVHKEFCRADIFVLPTLADSFGLVHLEALACGVPVITTPHCGSVIRDGIEGFIVPIRDSKILAERIKQLVEDRQLREQMSQAAKKRAKDFTWSKYSARLLKAFQL